jgi:hypothetical protein
MLDAKTLGWLGIIGGLVAGWLSWGDWGVVVLALVVLLGGLSHVSGK